MKKHRVCRLVLGLISALVIEAGTPAAAYDNSSAVVDSGGDFFANEVPIGNEELDDMRGGFIARNGMVINFSFSANTLIDGQLINQVALNTADLAASAGSLRRIIQVGEGNQAFNSATDTGTLPNVLTIVQNNMDNLTIQQLNLLDLAVENMSNFINQSISPEIDFQNAMTLAP